MSHLRFLLSLLLCVWVAGVAQAASVETARALIENRELDNAKRELEEVLDSATGNREKAEALDLLGTLAVDQKDFESASAAWSRLMDDYPELAEEFGARTKLFLVDTLLGRDSETEIAAPVGAQPAPEHEDVVEVSQTAERAPAPKPAETERTATADAESVSAAKAQASVAAPVGTDLVLIAAEGNPFDAAQATADRIMEYLGKRGVKIESATEGVPVMMNSAQAWASLMRAVEESHAGSFLYVRSEYESRQKITITAHTPEGAELWTEKVRGGSGWTGRTQSPSGINEELVERALKRLGPRTGGPGLPISETADGG